MGRRKTGRDIHGIVLLDKPAGISSNHALQKVRRLFDARKGGHTGNLDPFATGMLPICLGDASKTAGFMLDADKSYLATARLGQTTETGDPEGAVIRDEPVPTLSEAELQACLQSFTGEIEQLPPMYSALKHKGQPLYKLARQGQIVERKTRRVTIHGLRLLSWQSPELQFEVHCSKGTYVRTLAEDMALSLGSCAHLVALRRLDVEPFEHQGMISLETLAGAAESGTLEQHLLPADAGLANWPVVTLTAVQMAAMTHGNAIQINAEESGWVRIYGPDQQLLGLGQCQTDGMLQPKRVFAAAGLSLETAESGPAPQK